MLTIGIIGVGDNSKVTKFLNSSRFNVFITGYNTAIHYELGSQDVFLAYLSPLDDSLVTENSEQRIPTSYLGNLINITFIKLLLDKTIYSNKVYLNNVTSYEILEFTSHNLIIRKDYKQTSKDVKYIKNGIKFDQNEVIFDEKGNFYTKNPATKPLSLVTRITGKPYFFTDESYFYKPKFLGILNPKTETLLIIDNRANQNIIIDQAYNLAFLYSNVSMQDNIASTKIEIKLFDNYRDFSIRRYVE